MAGILCRKVRSWILGRKDAYVTWEPGHEQVGQGLDVSGSLISLRITCASAPGGLFRPWAGGCEDM